MSPQSICEGGNAQEVTETSTKTEDDLVRGIFWENEGTMATKNWYVQVTNGVRTRTERGRSLVEKKRGGKEGINESMRCSEKSITHFLTQNFLTRRALAFTVGSCIAKLCKEKAQDEREVRGVLRSVHKLGGGELKRLAGTARGALLGGGGGGREHNFVRSTMRGRIHEGAQPFKGFGFVGTSVGQRGNHDAQKRCSKNSWELPTAVPSGRRH